MCGVAYLLTQNYRKNKYGADVPDGEPERREILTFERSITRAEWSAGGRLGLNPQLVLVTPKCNYYGEELIEYNGVVYKIYRTYALNEDIELYLEFHTGVAND